MYATKRTRWAASFHRGLERWDRWLQERLSPARVALRDWSVNADGECSWRVEYPFGAVTMIRIPRSLVESDADEFRRATEGLGAFAWETALEQAGASGISLMWH